MRSMLSERKFQGVYVEGLANGSDKKHHGMYYVVELKTRYLVTFVPFGYYFPLFQDFCILKNKKQGFSVVTSYIDSNWV